jgi:nitrogen regulatory protein PII 2
MNMVEIWAIVRRDRVTATRKVLDSMGLGAMSVISVTGRGKQGGFSQSETEARELPAGYETSAPRLVPTPSYLVSEGATITKPVTYIPKKAIMMVIPKASSAEAIDAIMSVNRTGHHGDGKLFVMPIEESVRIRTGEEGLDAIDY